MISNPIKTSTMAIKTSGRAILLSNAFTIGLAVIENWEIRTVLIIYWAQSVIIGIFNFFRMILLKNFSTKGLTSNGEPVPETSSGKWSTAIFFAFHYGAFHVAYAGFIFGGSWALGMLDLFWIVVAVAAFLWGHWFSFQKNVATDLAGRPNLGTMMFLPYARIIPMHLSGISGLEFGADRLAVPPFLLLKTFADWLMHVVEHQVLQKNNEDCPPSNPKENNEDYPLGNPRAISAADRFKQL
jgi:hypothetical protein